MAVGRRAVAAALLVGSTTWVPLAAQSPVDGGPSDFEMAAVNALLGGAGAGITRFIRGGAFTPGFAWGALGGAVAFAGKSIEIRDARGAAFVGRQIGAVGASLTRRAALGGHPLDTLVLPVWLLNVYVPVRSPRRASVHVDVLTTASLAYGLMRSDFAFDLRRSASTGALVFTTDRGFATPAGAARGAYVGGIVVVKTVGGAVDEGLFGHERVHELQIDYLKTTLALPLEGALRAALGEQEESSLRAIDLGFASLPIWYLGWRWYGYDAPWETEAAWLTERR